MFDGIFKPKFYTKCKSLIKLTKTRLENVRKKKRAVCKYLKNDIADLLINGLDYNAYGRTKGLLDEKKRIFCYDLVEWFYGCVESNVSLMQKSRECPEECREAVSSLIYAAARIPEIPELCHLRSLFTRRYGNSLEPFTNQEFVEIFKLSPPTKEMRLQLMHEIAQEFSIDCDLKDLKQKLFTPAPKAEFERPEDKIEPENQHGRKASVDDNNKIVCSSSSSGESSKTRDSFERDSVEANWSSFGSISEDEPETKNPFYHWSIPTLYSKPISEKEESNSEDYAGPKSVTNDIGKEEKSSDLEVGLPVGTKPVPRSVRRRFARPLPEVSEFTNENSGENMQAKVKNGVGVSLANKTFDEALIYPLKLPPYMEALSRRRLRCESMGKWKLKKDMMSYSSGSRTHVRCGLWQPEPSTVTQAANSFELPDYDELAAMLAEIRRR